MEKKVLVIEDDPNLRKALSLSLKSAKMNVTAVSNGEDGLRRIREKSVPVVVTDIRLPGLSGTSLLKKVRRLSPSTAVILMTAYGDVEDAVEAIRAGALDYILKPFEPDRIVDAVSRAFKSLEPPLDPEKGIRLDEKHVLITRDPEKKRVLGLAERAAQSDATVLIKAESGTGKELLARFIHARGSRRKQPFLAVNCAALPDSLLESELFGYEKGAFTGAETSKMGRFELANGGTLLLDEISELAPLLQAKLLRVLQEREVDRVGGREPIPIDVRVIAITNRDLEELVRNGKFREDLYYRLNVIPLTIPPLRMTKGDIPILVTHFSEKFSRGARPVAIPETRMREFLEYSWPGNVRELENIIQRLTVLGEGGEVKLAEVKGPYRASDSTVKLSLEPGTTLRDAEQALIIHTLKKADGNRTHAARILGIGLRTLRNKLKEYRECGTQIPD